MSTSDWWARKLGAAPAQGQPAAPRPYTPQPPPSQQAPPRYFPPPPQDPDEEQEEEGGLHRGDPESWSRASKAAKEEKGTCPECGSGNYFDATYKKKGSSNSHCFDCGYPIIQSGSGLPSMAGDATKVPMVGKNAAENVAARQFQEKTAAANAAERAQLKQQGKSDLLGPLG